MRRRLACLLAIVIVLSLAGCGGENMEDISEEADGYQIDNSTISAKPSDISPLPADEDENNVSATPPEETDIAWTEVSYTTTDADGYNYEITFKLSPWILLSDNADIIDSIWTEIGKGNELPGFDDWGLTKMSNFHQRSFIQGALTRKFTHAMTDMYYCLGTVQIKNITNGWSITSESSRNSSFGLTWASGYELSGGSSSTVYSIGKVFYSDSAEDEDDGLDHGAKMTNDYWGPAPFIIMAPENFSPNYPYGQRAEDMLNGFFYYGDNIANHPVAADFSGWKEEELPQHFYLGVIGQDGMYSPPIDTTYIKNSIPLLDEGAELIVRGHSMAPTLVDGDKVTITHPTGSYASGDIVVLQMSNVSDDYIFSRIIATEGQTVDIDFENGVVYVDGAALDEPYTSSATIDPVDFTGPQLVPEGCVFILGDNRDGALDSRTTDVGMIKTRYILGKVA